MQTFKYLLFTSILLFLSFPAFVKPTEELIQSFVDAMSAANQPATIEADIKHYLTFMTDDFTDFHAAYNVTVSGKDKVTQNMLNKIKTRHSFKIKYSDLILGTDTAVLVINEESVYLKDEKIKHFTGRTIWLLEFNANDKIQHIRRYLD